MIENMKKMCCGNCGDVRMCVYSKPKADRPNEVMVECQGCKSVTAIRTSKPAIEFDWGENSKGILCHLS